MRSGEGAACNVAVLKPSRTRPTVGDVVVCLPSDGGGYLFGRVIRTDANAGVRDYPAVLSYVYRHRQPECEPVPYAQMSLDTLLLPPLLTNHTPWTRGIFLTIAHRDLMPGEAHPCHYFLDLNKGIIVDENGEPAPGHEPMGNWGLGSFRSADDAISRALGLPLAAD